MRRLLGLLAATFAISAQGATPCAARSGPNANVLVELYTSQGCPACPRAEEWLSRLAGREGVVALAIAVDEPSAKRDAWLRQRKLTRLQRLALLARPHVLLQGQEFSAWESPAFDATLAKLGARPARVSLRLEIAAIRSAAVAVRASAAGESEDLGLYLAAYERRPESGFNRALEWLGPLSVGPRHERTLRLPAAAAAVEAGVVGFVQNRRNSEVVQALMLAACP
jgi:hypothetical protein